MDISLKTWYIQDTIHRTHEAQEKGKPKCEFFHPYWKVDQNTHGSQPTNRMNSRNSTPDNQIALLKMGYRAKQRNFN